jgi:hypothetical protein
MTSSLREAGLVALAMACALAGCGGGSDDADPNRVQITFGQKPFVLDVFDDSLSELWCEIVTVQPVPSAPPTVRAFDSGATFVSGQIYVFTFDTGRFLACPAFQPTLAVGAHSGTLTFTMCRDSGCAQPYSLSDSSLPYSVTVWHVVPGLPLLTATIQIDGVVSNNVNEGFLNDVRTYGVALMSGQTIEVDPSQPFLTWAVNSHGTQARLTPLAPPQAGSVLGTVTLPAGVSAGTIELVGRSSDGRTIDVTIAVSR